MKHQGKIYVFPSIIIYQNKLDTLKHSVNEEFNNNILYNNLCFSLSKILSRIRKR